MPTKEEKKDMNPNKNRINLIAKIIYCEIAIKASSS